MLTVLLPRYRHDSWISLLKAEKYSRNHQFVYKKFEYLCSFTKHHHFNTWNMSAQPVIKTKCFHWHILGIRHAPWISFFNVRKYKKNSSIAKFINIYVPAQNIYFEHLKVVSPDKPNKKKRKISKIQNVQKPIFLFCIMYTFHNSFFIYFL